MLQAHILQPHTASDVAASTVQLVHPTWTSRRSDAQLPEHRTKPGPALAPSPCDRSTVLQGDSNLQSKTRMGNKCAKPREQVDRLQTLHNECPEGTERSSQAEVDTTVRLPRRRRATAVEASL